MTIYTIVDDGYDVTVCKSIKAVLDFVGSSLSSTPEDDAPLSKLRLKAAITLHDYVRLYELGERDWKYRIQSHN